MIRLYAFIAILASLAPLCAAQDVYTPGQRPSPPPQTGNITLSGTVVNSVTGEGVPRALVQLNGIQLRSVLTDSAGRFEFDQLPEMQAVITARKPGFFSDQELSRGFRFEPTMIRSGMGPVAVKLVPAGVITGQVTTPDGDPIEGVFLRLKAPVIVEGRKQWNEHGGARSDENGEFRIANLQPGKYYLFSNTTQRVVGAPSEAFAASYYPGVADISGASPIQIQAGQTFVANLTLQPEKAYSVSGVVTGLPPGQFATVHLINSSNESLPFQSGAGGPDGSFELARVPAGTYTLKAMSQGGMRFGFGPGMGGGGGRAGARFPQRYTGSAVVNVSGDVTGVAIPMQPAADVPVNVRTDFTNPQTSTSGAFVTYADSQKQFRQFVHITLRRVDGPNGYGSMMDASGNMVIRDVEPGRYRAEFNAMGANLYVQAASFGTTDLLRDDLVITGGGDQQPIEVVVRDDAASLSGTADCGGTTCWVLVIPDGASSISPRQMFVSPAGTFQAVGLPPGSYRVYAFNSLDGIEYSNPEVMKAYDGSAASVTLSAGQKGQVSLGLTKAEGQ